jgi:hypothetical protein
MHKLSKDASLDEIDDALTALGEDLDSVVKQFDVGQINKQVKNRRGIEIHSRLADCTDRLEAIEAAGDRSDRQAEVHQHLQEVATVLLRDIFHVMSTDK